MKFFILSILLFFFQTLYASASIGTVSLCKGSIKLKASHSIKKMKVKVGTIIKEGDLLSSSKNASAKLKLIDGSVIVLDEKSSIYFHSLSQAEQQTGKILYKITSRDAKNSLKIKTSFAIIGIKGTTFIVETSKKSSVSLKEGLLSIKSINKEFQLYREKLEAEFKEYKKEGLKHIQKQKDDFENYKNEETSYKEVKSVKKFELNAGKKIVFQNQNVKENSFSKDDEAQYIYFYKLLNSMK